MTIDEALEIIKRDDNDMRKGYFCINDYIKLATIIVLVVFYHWIDRNGK